MPRPSPNILVVLVFTVWVFQGMSYHPHHGISADLPKVLHPIAMRGALREDAMKVTIMRDGKVYFGNEQICRGSLSDKIQGRLKDREVERKVYIVADMRARWSDVEQALDAVRSAFLANQGRLPMISR
jgi:biopolymer transport protein ExbD